METPNFKMRMDETLKTTLEKAAASKGLSEAELARRLLRRGLALDAGDSGAVILSHVVGGVVRDIVAPIRQLAYEAAFEASVAHMLVLQLLGEMLTRMGVPREAAAKHVGDQDAAARKKATEQLRAMFAAIDQSMAEAGLPGLGDDFGDAADLYS